MAAAVNAARWLVTIGAGLAESGYVRTVATKGGVVSAKSISLDEGKCRYLADGLSYS